MSGVSHVLVTSDSAVCVQPHTAAVSSCPQTRSSLRAAGCRDAAGCLHQRPSPIKCCVCVWSSALDVLHCCSSSQSRYAPKLPVTTPPPLSSAVLMACVGWSVAGGNVEHRDGRRPGRPGGGPPVHLLTGNKMCRPRACTAYTHPCPWDCSVSSGKTSLASLAVSAHISASHSFLIPSTIL